MECQGQKDRGGWPKQRYGGRVLPPVKTRHLGPNRGRLKDSRMERVPANLAVLGRESDRARASTETCRERALSGDGAAAGAATPMTEVKK